MIPEPEASGLTSASGILQTNSVDIFPRSSRVTVGQWTLSSIKSLSLNLARPVDRVGWSGRPRPRKSVPAPQPITSLLARSLAVVPISQNVCKLVSMSGEGVKRAKMYSTPQEKRCPESLSQSRRCDSSKSFCSTSDPASDPQKLWFEP